jgi:hypothetical protein
MSPKYPLTASTKTGYICSELNECRQLQIAHSHKSPPRTRLMTSPATFRSVVIIDERTRSDILQATGIAPFTYHYPPIKSSARKLLRKCEWIVVNVTLFDEWLLRFPLVPQWRQCIIYVSLTSLYNFLRLTSNGRKCYVNLCKGIWPQVLINRIMYQSWS